MGENVETAALESASRRRQDDGEAVPNPDPRRWYVVTVHTNNEDRAADFLRKTYEGEKSLIERKLACCDLKSDARTVLRSRLQSMAHRLPIDVFVPKQVVHVRKNRRIVKKERVVLHSRLLLFIEPSELFRLVNAARQVAPSLIIGLMYEPGTKIPAVIPIRQLELFKYILGYTEGNVEVKKTHVRLDARVRVIRGNLQGLQGHVCKLFNGKGQEGHTVIGVSLGLLGAACIHIPLSDLEVVDVAE